MESTPRAKGTCARTPAKHVEACRSEEITTQMSARMTDVKSLRLDLPRRKLSRHAGEVWEEMKSRLKAKKGGGGLKGCNDHHYCPLICRSSLHVVYF